MGNRRVFMVDGKRRIIMGHKIQEDTTESFLAYYYGFEIRCTRDDWYVGKPYNADCLSLETGGYIVHGSPADSMEEAIITCIKNIHLK